MIAAGDDVARLRRQRWQIGSRCRGQQGERFGIVEQLNLMLRAAQTRDKAGIAGGDDSSATRAEDVKAVGVLPLPDIIKEQSSIFFDARRSVSQGRPWAVFSNWPSSPSFPC